MTWGNYLKEIYYNPANAGSFSEPDKLYRYVQTAGKYAISKHRIRQWLQRQEVYNLQRPVRRHFKRNRVITMGIDDQWDADLMDMSKYSKGNDEYAYVLVVIDIFLKYVWLRSLRTKMGRYVRRAFVEEGKRPNRVRTNKGQEFRSKEFNRLLQEFAGNYIITYHRTMGMAPKTVTKSKETELWWRMHWPKKQELIGKAKVVRKPFRLNVGDQVRITYIRHPFTREYHEK